MVESADVHAKLVLDDHATEALNHVREGFHKVGEKVHEVTAEIGAMLKQSLAVAAGFQLSGAIDSIKEMGHEAVAAAAGAEQQQKALAGLIAMTDQTGMSFDETMTKAVELHDDLEQIGIAAGVSSDQVIEAFETIASRSQKSTEEVKALTEEMSQAGRALPGGVQTLAAAYRDLETGIVRPKNALVQLMKQTGTVQGSMKQIAKSLTAELQAGHIEKVFGLAEQAVGKMSEKMRKAPPTFKEVVQSLKDVRENMFEALGTPVLKALVPQLDRLRHYLTENREAIEAFATTATDKVAAWIAKSADTIRAAFAYLRNHADQIRDALEKGAAVVKGAFEFAVKHKEAITLAVLARHAPGIAGAAGGVVNAGRAVGSGAKAVGGLLGSGSLDLKFLAAIGELGPALPLAAAGAIALAGAFDVLSDETNEYHATATRTWQQIEENWRVTWAVIQPLFSDLGVEVKDVSELLQKMMDYGGVLLLESLRNLSAEVRTQVQVLQDFGKGIRWVLDKMGWKSTPAMTDTAGEHESITRTFEVGGVGGSTALIAAAAKAAVGKPLSVNLNVGTMNIKQDFRDQDPDRIAVVFRNDLAKNATNRLGARTLGPLGPFSGG